MKTGTAIALTLAGVVGAGLFGAAMRRRGRSSKKNGKKKNGTVEPWADHQLLQPGQEAFVEVGTDLWVQVPNALSSAGYTIEIVDTMAGVQCVVVGDVQVRAEATYVLLRPVLAKCRSTVRFLDPVAKTGGFSTLQVQIDTGFEAA